MPNDYQALKTLVALIHDDKAMAALAFVACFSCAALWRFLQRQTRRFQDRLISQIEQQHKIRTLEAHQESIKKLTEAIKSVAVEIKELNKKET